MTPNLSRTALQAGRDDALEACRRRMELVAITFVVFLSISFGLSTLWLGDSPLRGPSVRYMPTLILIPALCFLTMRFLPLARRAPILAALPWIVAEAVLGGIMLSAYGGLDGPQFYAVYTLPALFIPLPMELRSRIAITLVTTGTFVTTFAIRQPGLLEHPMVHMPFLYVFAVSLLYIVMGNELARLHVERAALVQRLETEQDSLRGQLDWLQAHSELRIREAQGLSDELAELQIRERRDIASKLHDSLAQITLAARLQLDALGRGDREGRGADGARALNEVLAALDAEMRRAIEELRSARESETTVGDLVTGVVRAHPASDTAELRLDHEAEAMVVRGETATAVRGFVQEGLTNAMKHARPGPISLSARRADGWLRFAIEDGGPAESRHDAPAAHYGLAGLEDRARRAGGDLRVVRGPRTRLELELPVPRNESARIAAATRDIEASA